MAMKGLSLDGATKLKAALDTYAKGYAGMGAGWNSDAYYGKNTKIAKTFDEIMKYICGRGSAGKATIASYQNQLNQIINKYSSFDNTGSQTLGKVIPVQKKS